MRRSRLAVVLVTALLAGSLLGGCNNDPQPVQPAPMPPPSVAAPANPQAVPPPVAPPVGGAPTAAGGDADQESPGDATAPSNRPSSGLGVVLASALNVRSGAGVENSRVGLLHCGDVVAIEGREGDWYRVRLETLAGFSHGAYMVEVGPGGKRPECEGIARKPGAINDSPITGPQRDPNAIRSKDSKTMPEPAGGSGAQAGGQGGKSAGQASSPKVAKKASPSNVTLPASNGAVKVPHAKHKKDYGLGCGKCHHPVQAAMAEKAGSDKNCRACHGTGISPKGAKDAFHGTCRDCHKTMGAGPQSCTECHVK